VGDVLLGWLLLWQAEIALQALADDPSGDDRDYYAGKIAAANFFAKTVLPRLSAERRILETVDLSVMDIPETAF